VRHITVKGPDELGRYMTVSIPPRRWSVFRIEYHLTYELALRYAIVNAGVGGVVLDEIRRKGTQQCV
jgi:hypothetical protein